MGKNIKFRLKRKVDAPPIDDEGGEIVGIEVTVNVAGWPAPQVVAGLLTDEAFGNFVGESGTDNGTLETRLIDNDGNKSAVPFTKTFSLPDTFSPATPGDVVDVELEGEEETPPPEPVLAKRRLKKKS